MVIFLIIVIMIPVVFTVAYGWEITLVFWIAMFGGSLILKIAGLGF